MDMILRAPVLDAGNKTVLPARPAPAAVPATTPVPAPEIVPSAEPAKTVGEDQAAAAPAGPPAASPAVGEAAVRPAAPAAEEDLEDETPPPLLLTPEQQRELAIRQQAEEARQQAEASYAAAAKKGYAEGYEKGLAAGQAESSGRFAAGLQRLETLLAKCAEARALTLAAVEDEVVELVLAVVAKLAGPALCSRDGIAVYVKEVLGQVVQQEPVRIRLHPHDLGLLAIDQGGAGAANPLPASLAGHGVSWVADESLEHGGCVVETSAGDLEARLERRLADLLKVLLDARRQEAGDAPTKTPAEAPIDAVEAGKAAPATAIKQERALPAAAAKAPATAPPSGPAPAGGKGEPVAASGQQRGTAAPARPAAPATAPATAKPSGLGTRNWFSSPGAVRTSGGFPPKAPAQQHQVATSNVPLPVANPAAGKGA